MNGDKVFRRIGTSIDGNGIDATRMKLEVFGAVVDLVVDNNPHILFRIVLFDFGHGVLLAGQCSWVPPPGRSSLASPCTSKRRPNPAESGLPAIVVIHPPVCCPGCVGMLKSKDVFATGRLVHVDLDTKDLIVAHSHEIPSWIDGLRVVGLVPCTAHDFLASNQVGNLELVVLPDPAPVHAVFGWLFLAINFGQFPVDASIGD